MTKYIENVQLVNGVKYKINTVPAGGNKGQVLTKSGDGRDELEWLTPEVYDDSELVADIEALEANKADKADVYIKDEVYTKQEIEDKNYLVAADIEGKADQVAVHASLLLKADKSDTYTKTEVNELFDNLDLTVPEEYITETELESKGYLIESDLDDYALISEIPTNLSELENDAKFINIEDVEAKNYLVASDIEGKADKSDVYTKNEIDGKLTGAFHYKGNVPSEKELPTNAQQGDVYNDLSTGANYAFNGTEWDKLSETLDLSVFYTKEEADNKFTTLTEVGKQGYLIESDLQPYAKTEDIPTDFYTQEEVNTRLDSKANVEHTQSTNSINKLTGYVKGEAGKLSVEDTLNQALGKLEANLDTKQQAGDYALASDIEDVYEEIDSRNYITIEDVEAKNYLTEIPAEYITEEELQGKGYLTEVPSEYITEQELADKKYLVASDIAGKADIETVNNALDLKADKQYTYTKSEVDEKITDAVTEGKVDLTGYAKTEDVDASLLLKADKETTYTKQEVDTLLESFVTEIPEEYITEQELTDKGFATTQQLNDGLNEKQDKGDYALKSELPVNVSELQNDAGYLTYIPEDYITEEELNAKGYITDISGKQDTLTTSQLSAVNSGIDADKVSAYNAHIADVDIHVTLEDKAEWTAKQDALTESQMGAVNSGITSDKVNKYDAYEDTINAKANSADVYTKQELDNKLSSVYKYKGTLESVELLPEEAEIGDVYNADDTGANYAWTGTTWDKLSENIDLTIYATKEQLDLKQDKLTAGANIKIENNIISANIVDSYTKEESNDLLLQKQDSLVAGSNITIEDNIISAKTVDAYTKEESDELLVVKQNKLKAGPNIKIEEDTISCLIESSGGNDDITITLTPQNQLQTVAVKTLNDIIKFDWIGTLAEYENDLERGIITDNTVCFVTDD